MLGRIHELQRLCFNVLIGKVLKRIRIESNCEPASYFLFLMLKYTENKATLFTEHANMLKSRYFVNLMKIPFVTMCRGFTKQASIVYNVHICSLLFTQAVRCVKAENKETRKAPKKSIR